MNVDDIVAAKIAAARARIEANKRRRAALAAARQRGLARRNAQKLRNQSSVRATDRIVTASPTETAVRGPARTSDRESPPPPIPKEDQ